MTSELRVTTLSNATGDGPATLTKQSAAKFFIDVSQDFSTIQASLNISSLDDDGTGDLGVWTITPDPGNTCGIGSLSDINDPNAIFTGEAGTYVLTWTVNGCGSNMTIEIGNCN